MRSASLKISITLSFFLLTAGLQAQPAGRYVVRANLYLSVGDGTIIWLNGQQLVNQDPYRSVTKGYVTLKLAGDQLCSFGKENLLALEITDSIEDHTILNEKDNVGIAYVLEAFLSDGEQWIISSSDQGQHALFKTDHDADSNPAGWRDKGYDDSAWPRAQLTGPSTEIEKVLTDPKTRQTVQYLMCFSVVNLKAQHGERRLFRRKFAMDVVPGPGCPQPRIFPTKTPTPRSLPPTPTSSPTPRPTLTPVPTRTPVPTATPRPRPTLTPTLRPVVRPPAPTPTPVIVKRRPPAPTPTRVPPAPPAWTPTKVRRTTWVTPSPTPRLRPTATTTEVPQTGGALPQTIVFVHPPVNIFVTFGDGPGKYKLEVVDAGGTHLKTLYDKRVGAERETWMSWDGTNDAGDLMPVGHYSAVFSKDGKVLRHIALVWISPDK